MPRRVQALITVSWILLLAGPGALAQQSPGYFAPTFSSPTLSVGAGVWYCNNAQAYVPNATITVLGSLYVFLQSSVSCTSFQTNTTGFPVGAVPIASVISGVLTDARAWLPPWLPVFDASSFAGTDGGARIGTCIAALPPTTGGVCDARALTGPQTIGATITFNAPAVLLLGTATFTPTVLPAFKINSNNVAISGSHFGVTTINIPDLSYGADLFSFGTGGPAAFKINDLTVGIVSGGLSSPRTGSVFNLSTAAGGGMIFKNLRLSGDSNHSAGDVFNDWRTSNDGGGGQYEISDVMVGGNWERFIHVANTQSTCGPGGNLPCTTGSIHISRVMTLRGAKFNTAEFDLDQGVDTFDVDNSELGNSISPGIYAIWLHNSNSANNPINPRLVTFDHVFLQNSGGSGVVGTLVQLDAAKGFRLMNSYLTGAVYGVTVGGLTQDTNLSGNTFTELSYNAIVVKAAALKTSIQNNTFADCNNLSGSPYFDSVIYLAAGTNYVEMIGNRLTTQTPNITLPVNFVYVEHGSTGFVIITGNDLGVAGTDYSGSNAINLNSDTSALYTIADNTPFEAFHLVAGGSDNQFHFLQWNGTSAVENWKIDSNGNLIAPGSSSLGIGTTSSAGLLDVHGSAGDFQIDSTGKALFTRGAANYLYASATGGWLDFIVNGNTPPSDATAALRLAVTGEAFFQKAVVAGLKDYGTVTSSVTLDASLGNTQKVTLGSNVSSTLSNCAAGQWLVIDIIQGTSTYSFTWPSNVLNAGTIGTSTSKHNIQTFYCDGTDARATSPMLINQN